MRQKENSGHYSVAAPSAVSLFSFADHWLMVIYRSRYYCPGLNFFLGSLAFFFVQQTVRKNGRDTCL